MAIVTLLFVERSLDDLPPAVWMEPLVHDAGHAPLPTIPIMIDGENVAVRDILLMLRASPKAQAEW